MMLTLAAISLLGLPDGLPPEDAAEPERLPASLAEEAPPRFRRWRRRQEQDPLRERPSGVDAARLREEAEAGAWSFNVAPTLILMGGRTRVREGESTPVWLDLSGDLGMDAAAGVRLGFAHETRRARWFVEVDLSRTRGRGWFDRDFSYDEGDFAGGVPYRSHADFFFSRAGIALPGAIWERRDGRISPFIGLEYVRLSAGIDQPATGESTSEQYEQFMPYPIAGVLVEFRVSDAWTLSGRLYGGLLPNVGTPFMEGGRLSMKVETIALDLEVSWQASGSIRFFAAVGYQYWNARLRSQEDGNEFRLSASQVRFGIEIGW